MFHHTENINKETEIIKKSQTEILELKSTINKIFTGGAQQQT